MKHILIAVIFLFAVSSHAFELQDNLSGGLYSLDYSSLLLYEDEFNLFNPLMMEGEMSAKRSYFAHIHNRLDFFFLKNNALRLRHVFSLDFPFESPEQGRFRQKISLDFSLFSQKKVQLFGGATFYHLVEGFSPSANIPATEGHLGMQAKLHKIVDFFITVSGGYNMPASTDLVGYGAGPFVRGDTGLYFTFYNKYSSLSLSFLGGWYGLDESEKQGDAGTDILANTFYLAGLHFDFTIAGERGGAKTSLNYLYTKRTEATIIQQDMVFYFEQQLLSAGGTLFFELEDDNGQFYFEYTFATTMNNMSNDDAYGYSVDEYSRHQLLLGFLIRFETVKRKPWNERNRRRY